MLHSVSRAAEAFKAHVESATGGDLQINLVRHGASSGNDREITDQLRLGELEFNLPGAGGVAGIFPEAQTHSWAFLFTDRLVFWELPLDPEYFQITRDMMLEATGDEVRLLSLMENSVRDLYTTRGPIRTPADMEEQGIEMRTQAVPMHQEVFTALGASQIQKMIEAGDQVYQPTPAELAQWQERAEPVGRAFIKR